MLRIEHVDARDWMRPMGAPPVEPVEPEPQDMGDALALDRAIVEAAPQSYKYRWYWAQGTPPEAA